MKHILKFFVFGGVILAALFAAAPTFAQGGGTTRSVAPDLTLFTRYPIQEVALGETVNIDLTLRTQEQPQTVKLEVQDLPAGWNASFKGGGDNIRAAYVEPEEDTKIKLRVDPPADVAGGTYDFTVIATGEGQKSVLPIELIIKDKVPAHLAFSTDLPTLRGTLNSSFRYDVKLKNEGDDDLTVNLIADAPPGFLVNFKLSGKDVTSIPVNAGETKRITVEAKAYAELPADSYPINVLAQGDNVQAQMALTAEVTGQPKLNVTAPDGRLSAEAYAGDSTPMTMIVKNTGTAPVRNVKLSAKAPNGWEVNFEPDKITELAAGKQIEVTTHLKPADQAIAGDYMVTFKATPEDGAAESADFRITVLTSTMWGIVGVGLIAVAVVVIGLAVTRFGRR